GRRSQAGAGQARRPGRAPRPASAARPHGCARAQLDLAAELDLPVVIHLREKDDAAGGPCAEDAMSILEEWVAGLGPEKEALRKNPGVLHFSRYFHATVRASRRRRSRRSSGPASLPGAGLTTSTWATSRPGASGGTRGAYGVQVTFLQYGHERTRQGGLNCTACLMRSCPYAIRMQTYDAIYGHACGRSGYAGYATMRLWPNRFS
ncbi:MAG: hypothetical protein R6W76_01010, partial [Caldilinea sp.]